MKPNFTMPAALCLAIALLAADAAAVTIDTVPVGNVGNAPDENYNDLGQYGAVDHAYRIGKYEVTNSQYAEFLNAKAKSDPFNLYNTNMGGEIHGGISKSGLSGSFSYEVRTNMGDKPVNYVNFYDAIRFANWLNNGQGGSDTETGAYSLSDGDAVARNSGATWFLPTGDEWYKAAYYDPRLESEGGPAGDDNYWYYPTMSDSLPTTATANSVGDISNPGRNVANYNNGAVWNGYDSGNVTTVDSAGPLSNSYYGTADQGGNLWEWSDQFGSGNTRGLKGGSWAGDSGVLLTAYWSGYGHSEVTNENWTVGFRVATVPEPASVALLALGLPILLWRKLRGISGSGTPASPTTVPLRCAVRRPLVWGTIPFKLSRSMVAAAFLVAKSRSEWREVARPARVVRKSRRPGHVVRCTHHAICRASPHRHDGSRLDGKHSVTRRVERHFSRDGSATA